MPTDRPRRFRFDGHDAARIAAIVTMVIFALAMSNFVRDQWSDEAQFTHRDFHNFHNAGVRIRAGEDVYQHDEIPFLLTPISAPAVVALSYVPEHAAFVLAAVVTLLFYVLAVVTVARACRAERRATLTAVFVACSMPSIWFALYLGQLTGLYLVLLAPSLTLLVEPRAEVRGWGIPIGAGVLTALLCVKPQLALVVLVVALVRRAWVALAAFAVALALLWAISIPFLGVSAIVEWREQAAWCAGALEGAESTWWRQFTLYAFLRSVTSRAGMDLDVARGMYLAIVVPMGLATLLAVRRALAPDERRFSLRAVGIMVLATIALNGYLFYYDAAFLVVPWMVAFLCYGTYAPFTRWLILVVAVASWVLALTTPILEQGEVPLPGLVATIWLAIEILDLVRGKRALGSLGVAAPPLELPAEPAAVAVALDEAHAAPEAGDASTDSVLASRDP